MRLLVLLCLVAATRAYNHYKDAIPNGHGVAHPCKTNYMWPGVGHQAVLGGGARNPFGTDFAANSHAWDATLCNKDSDGDGRTNGDELGDPGCTWTSGNTPSRTTNITHPGICEPVDSAACISRQAALGYNVSCQLEQFTCNGTDAPDVQNFTIKFPNTTSVPAQETTYMCMMFKIPDDVDYHVIATEPVLDNLNVMHHTIVYGCNAASVSTIKSWSGYANIEQAARSCGMISSAGCEGIGGWTVGQSGSCLANRPYAIRIGKSKFTHAIIEHHWNNPRLTAGMTDGSGMKFYYTSNLRQYDMGTLILGEMDILVPPNMNQLDLVSTCSSQCTSGMSQSVNVVGALNHMHYLGKKGSIEHWRGGSKLQDLANDDPYSYDTPITHEHWPSVQLQAGDELKMTCSFQSTSRSTITYRGDGTQEEMCFGFVNYYPRVDNIYACLTSKKIQYCSMKTVDSGTGCDDSYYTSTEWYSEAAQIGTACDGTECTAACLSLLTTLYTTKPCLMNGHRAVLESSLLAMNATFHPLARSMRTCDLQLWNVTTSDLGSGAAPAHAHVPALVLVIAAGIIATLRLLTA